MSPNSVHAAASASGMRPVNASTTLERCLEEQESNAAIIGRIGSRVSMLLERLRGAIPATGCGDAPGGEGKLNRHLTMLNLEAQALGQLEADISELEALL